MRQYGGCFRRPQLLIIIRPTLYSNIIFWRDRLFYAPHRCGGNTSGEDVQAYTHQDHASAICDKSRLKMSYFVPLEGIIVRKKKQGLDLRL